MRIFALRFRRQRKLVLDIWGADRLNWRAVRIREMMSKMGGM